MPSLKAQIVKDVVAEVTTRLKAEMGDDIVDVILVTQATAEFILEDGTPLLEAEIRDEDHKTAKNLLDDALCDLQCGRIDQRLLNHFITSLRDGINTGALKNILPALDNIRPPEDNGQRDYEIAYRYLAMVNEGKSGDDAQKRLSEDYGLSKSAIRDIYYKNRTYLQQRQNKLKKQ